MTLPTPPGLEGLVDLACRDGVDIRPTLLRVLTDLYVQKPHHTPEEEQHYVELSQRLFKTVDEKTKAAVTARLMNYGQVPEALQPHLAIHMILPEAPLVPDAPAVTETSAVAETAEPVVEQPSPAEQASELTEIFFAATTEERHLILVHLDAATNTGAAPVRNAAQVVRTLESCALRHDAAAFARELVGALSLDRTMADRIVEDPSGEPLLLVAKVLEMPAAVLQRVLLFLNPSVGQSVQRVYELAALYDTVTKAGATHLLAIFRLATPASHPAYRSVLYQSELWDDGTIGAREAATPRQHRGNGGMASEMASDAEIIAAIRNR